MRKPGSVLISAHLILLATAFFVRADGGVPTPSFTRVDHASPSEYLVLHPSFGDAARIRKIASTLEAKTSEATISAIGGWIDKNLKYDANAPYVFRDFGKIIDSKVYGGCADHALVFATLAKAAGIPTVFVKTMDARWIREYKAAGACEVWSGHVFLEVFVDRKWKLLDATSLKIYDDYDPNSHILPGNRYAYDKGSDPYELVLSSDWERWKEQTADYFRRFDLAELPVGDGREVASPNDIYIAANSPIYERLTRRCQDTGFKVRTTFNAEYETYLKRARSHYLIITCVGNSLTPPIAKYAAFYPVTEGELTRLVRGGVPGDARKTLEDGTRVILLYARNADEMLKHVEKFEVAPRP